MFGDNACSMCVRELHISGHLIQQSYVHSTQITKSNGQHSSMDTKNMKVISTDTTTMSLQKASHLHQQFAKLFDDPRLWNMELWSEQQRENSSCILAYICFTLVSSCFKIDVWAAECPAFLSIIDLVKLCFLPVKWEWFCFLETIYLIV